MDAIDKQVLADKIQKEGGGFYMSYIIEGMLLRDQTRIMESITKYEEIAESFSDRKGYYLWIIYEKYRELVEVQKALHVSYISTTEMMRDYFYEQAREFPQDRIKVPVVDYSRYYSKYQ